MGFVVVPLKKVPVPEVVHRIDAAFVADAPVTWKS